MPTPSFPPQSDQAKHLRDLAVQNESLQNNQVHPHSAGPRGIMIGEFQGLNRGYPLAWQLATDACRRGLRTLVVDLTPAASRLPEVVQTVRDLSPNPQAVRSLPLWQESAHGRTLSAWQPSAANTIDILAQTAPAYPTAEQMARFCEQLIRYMTQPQCSMYDVVYFLSNASGIPHDSPCWQTANDLLLVWDEKETNELQLAAAIRARRSRYPENQRLLILGAKSSSLADWKIGRPKIRRSAAQQNDKSTLPTLLGENAEQRWLTLPKPELTKASVHRYVRAARELAAVLEQLPTPRSTRQAS